jgi:hypothetical protein
VIGGLGHQIRGRIPAVRDHSLALT